MANEIMNFGTNKTLTLMQEELSPNGQMIRAYEMEMSCPEERREIFFNDTLQSNYSVAFQQKVARWEKISGVGSDAIKTARHQFMDTVARMMLPPDVIKGYCTRWEDGDFTAVNSHYLMIDNAWSCFPGHGLPFKNEVDYETPNSRSGREDITMFDLEKYSWGHATDRNTMVAVRGKIPGTRYVKMGTRFVGDKVIEVPENFPVEAAERFGDKFYILSPIALPAFVYKDHQFERHPFVGPNEFIPEMWHEGIIVLMSDGRELRSKYIPAVDVKIDEEIWECTYNGGLKKLRPRMGKRGTNPSLIYSLVVPQAVLAKASKMVSPVTEVVVGDLRPTMTYRGQAYLLDSGYRMDIGVGFPVPKGQLIAMKPVTLHERVVMANDSRTVPQYRKDMHKPLMRETIGSKVILISEDGKSFLLLREQAADTGRLKPFDFPGGKLERNESPVEAVLREVKEEVGLDMDRRDLIELGKTDETEDNHFYRSYMFAYVADVKLGPHMKYVSFEDPPLKDGTAQKWYSRLITHVMDVMTPEMILDLCLITRDLSDGLIYDIHQRAFKDKCIVPEEARRIIHIKRPHFSKKQCDELMGAAGFEFSTAFGRTTYRYKKGLSNWKHVAWNPSEGQKRVLWANVPDLVKAQPPEYCRLEDLSYGSDYDGEDFYG